MSETATDDGGLFIPETRNEEHRNDDGGAHDDYDDYDGAAQQDHDDGQDESDVEMKEESDDDESVQGVEEFFDDNPFDPAPIDDNESDEERDGSAGDFRPADKLPSTQVLSMKISQLTRMVADGSIDLNASYQRGVVWNTDRKTRLVTSVIEGYYIPPVIFNRRTYDDPQTGKKGFTLVCVDGKQRLTSVMEFIQGKVPCRDGAGHSWWFKPSVNAAGKTMHRRKVLPKEVKDSFMAKKLLCCELENLDQDQEEELFARVQMGVQLNNAEKLRASRGRWQELASTFEEDFKPVVSLAGNKRSSAWLTLLACFSQIDEVVQTEGNNPKLKTSPQNIKKMMRRENTLTEATRAKLLRVLTTLKRIQEAHPRTFQNNNYTTTKTFAPVEFVAVAVLVAMYGQTRNVEMLSGDILFIRKELREAHKDLRLNSAVWASVWKLISTIEDTRGVTTNTSTSASLPSPPAATRKRKRTTANEGTTAERPKAKVRPTATGPLVHPTPALTSAASPMSRETAPLTHSRPEMALSAPASTITTTTQLDNDPVGMASTGPERPSNLSPPAASTVSPTQPTGRKRRERLNLEGLTPSSRLIDIKRSPTS